MVTHSPVIMASPSTACGAIDTMTVDNSEFVCTRSVLDNVHSAVWRRARQGRGVAHGCRSAGPVPPAAGRLLPGRRETRWECERASSS